MQVLAKLRILSDAATYDASCASSGARIAVACARPFVVAADWIPRIRPDDPLRSVAAQPSFFDRAATGTEAGP